MTAEKSNHMDLVEKNPLLCFIALGGVLIAVMSVYFRGIVAGYSSLFTLLWSRNGDLMNAGVIACLLNLGVAAGLLANVMGWARTQKKCGDLAEPRNNGSGPSLGVFLIGLSIGAVAYVLLSVLYLPGQLALLHLKSQILLEYVTQFLKINFALSAGLVGGGVASLPIWKKLSAYLPRKLPLVPKLTNGIILGSLYEDDLSKKTEWAIMPMKALFGNILVTGSIGSGKSSGTIFNYVAQILSNFAPKPALLAIDPKGKITKEILKLSDRLKLREDILHMTLDGSVTFNPIYQPSALKKGGYSDIAKMIRSAAVNYMGKSFDSPFWEESASNLIKNCLVYCAATKDYYTLNDLYTATVEASSKEAAFIEALEACLSDKKFDFEEKKNISFALQYFRFQYAPMDEKVRTGILATSSTFLNQFQEFRASQIFCPAQEDLTIHSMDQILNEGKILLFDITSDGLARSMGTFVKLHFEKALLDRMKQGRPMDRPGVLLIDEYQDVVTTGYGADLGDETFLAQGREANAISIMATQSLSSLENAIGRQKPTEVLTSGFRTKILGHSTDLATIKSYQELAGKKVEKRITRSLSENSQEPSSSSPNSVSESVSTSDQKEYAVTAHDFATLNTFESYLMKYEGVKTLFQKLYLKPHYLNDIRTPHSKVLKSLGSGFTIFALLYVGSVAVGSRAAYAFPNVCTVMKTSEANACLSFNVGSCVCGWPVPRPCASFSYYVPQTFVEVMPDRKESFFKDLPGAAAQLGLAGINPIPFGAEADDDTQSFHSHVTSVPFTKIPFGVMPCDGAPVDRLCFEGMSEYLGSHWTTGSADLLQPNFLAWGLSPKGCLLKGAVESIGGESSSGISVTPACAAPMSWLPKYPPSNHSACTGWGTFYPRTGVYHGPSSMTGALMVAARMKSLSNEVFRTTPTASDEVWQMIYPQSSSCFKEGQNVAALETVKNVREAGRFTSGKFKGYLFVVWSKASCCRDLVQVPTAYAAIASMSAACAGLGNL